MDIKQFKKLPIMGILRNISQSVLPPLLEIISDTGLKTIEIAMNTDNAQTLIKEAVARTSGKLTVGAGTVLNIKELKQALDSGATFIVTPILIEDVSEYCIRNKIPIFLGALSPTEIYKAWKSGATMVKVFPASVFGPPYFKEVKGPFNEVELMAVGGVTAENIPQYFSNGASAVAFGAGIFRKDWIDNKDFILIKKSIKSYVSAVMDCV